jgi:hypothetical protein
VQCLMMICCSCSPPCHSCWALQQALFEPIMLSWESHLAVYMSCVHELCT